MAEEVVPVAGPAPAAVSVADASALLAANTQLQQDLATARAQAARLEAADKAAHKTAAIASALAGAPLVSEAAAAQLTTLFERDITLTTDPSTGKTIAVGPGLVPAQTHIHTAMQRAEFSHFLKANNPQGGTGGAAAQSAPSPSGNPWGQAPPQPRTMGEAILQNALAQPRPQSAAFGADLGKRFGIPTRG